jgi:hypothetical protein
MASHTGALGRFLLVRRVASSRLCRIEFIEQSQHVVRYISVELLKQRGSSLPLGRIGAESAGAHNNHLIKKCSDDQKGVDWSPEWSFCL